MYFSLLHKAVTNQTPTDQHSGEHAELHSSTLLNMVTPFIMSVHHTSTFKMTTNVDQTTLISRQEDFILTSTKMNRAETTAMEEAGATKRNIQDDVRASSRYVTTSTMTTKHGEGDQTAVISNDEDLVVTSPVVDTTTAITLETIAANVINVIQIRAITDFTGQYCIKNDAANYNSNNRSTCFLSKCLIYKHHLFNLRIDCKCIFVACSCTFPEKCQN